MGGPSPMRSIPVCGLITEVSSLVQMPELLTAITVNSSSPLTVAIGLTKRTLYLERYAPKFTHGSGYDEVL